ncbi:hypothetical protein MD484_g3422, partial [Candolleomyces efflorescens]
MATYAHIPSRENLEMTETSTRLPVGAARPEQPGGYSGEDELLNMYRDREDGSPMLSSTTTNSNLSKMDRAGGATAAAGSKMKRGKLLKIVLAVAAIVAIAVAIALALVFTVGKKNSSSSGAAGASTTTGPNGGVGQSGTSGKSGSLVTMEDGSTFTYNNNFGGDWAAEPSKPFASGGKAQSWSPRIGSEEWKWGEHTIRGVNLGGWLVTEPFICPGLYEKYVTNDRSITVIDEWTLSQAMGDKLAEEMENHYKTFITEKDFADIAAAGLNWVRIPIGFWAIETMNDEPFLVGTSWTYFLKAMHGVMGIANAQRTLTYLRIFTEFVSQPQYKDVVQIVGIVNEILWATIGQEAVQSFYYAAYEAIRKSSGTGAGNGPFIAIHEGFQGPAIWEGFLAGSDRVVLDQHPYLAFMGDPNSTPESSAPKPCEWAIATNQSQSVFGVTVGGEFSTAINNCGLWLNGMQSDTIAGCSVWDDWASWDSTVINGLKQVTLASMDALQNFFFWTWRIGNSTTLGTSSSPMWHYQLGLERGWIPKDPREAIGHCAQVLGSSQIFDGNFPATATGGAGAGTLNPTASASHPFPPATISPSFSGTQIGLLPTYTPTGSLKTLPAPTFAAAPSASVGSGWNNAGDNEPAYVSVYFSSYPV